MIPELVLTGCRETWPENEHQAVFLGPWCFAANPRHSFFSQENFKLIPPPLKSKIQVLESLEYLDTLTDRILPHLADHLNAWYRSSFSLIFWKTSAIVWLSFWLGLLHERFSRLKMAEEFFNGGSYLVKLPGGPDLQQSWDYQAMSNHCHRHDFNLFLLSRICRIHPFLGMQKKEWEVHPGPPSLERSSPAFQSPNFRQVLGNTLIRLWRRFLRPGIYFGSIYGLSNWDKRYFELKLRRFPGKGGTSLPGIPPYSMDLSQFRKRPFSFGAKNDFELVVEKLLMGSIPTSIIQGLPSLEPHEGVDFWLGNDLFGSQDQSFKIARMVENGGKWISVQHGGGYGQALAFPHGKVEYETSGHFISWGWTHQHQYRTRISPLPSPLLSKLPEHSHQGHGVLFAGIGFPIYRHRPHYGLQPEEVMAYLKDKGVFCLALREDIRLSMKYKPYFADFGEQTIEYMLTFLAKPQILGAHYQASEALLDARLVVLDHLGTLLSEAMAMNVPLIAFWNPEHFAICDQAMEIFSVLKKVGILHETPESAAQKTNQVYVDAASWWGQPDIQMARNLFLKHFASTSSIWRSEWLKFLKTLCLEKHQADSGKSQRKNEFPNK